MEVSFSDQTDSLRLSWIFSDQVVVSGDWFDRLPEKQSLAIFLDNKKSCGKLFRPPMGTLGKLTALVGF